MLFSRHTLKQIIPTPGGYSLLWYSRPSEHHPNGSFSKDAVIAWALIEEGPEEGVPTYGMPPELTLDPVTVGEIGWPPTDQPVAILAPDGTVHARDGDSYDSIAAWMADNARNLKPA